MYTVLIIHLNGKYRDFGSIVSDITDFWLKNNKSISLSL